VGYQTFFSVFRTVGLLLHIEAEKKVQYVKQIKVVGVQEGGSYSVHLALTFFPFTFSSAAMILSLQGSTADPAQGAQSGSHHCSDKPVLWIHQLLTH
jgi:hypothetical protein